MNRSVIPVQLVCDRWQARLSPFVIRFDPSTDQEIEWSSADGPIEVVFPEGDSPFDGSTFTSTGRGPARSGPFRPGLLNGKKYFYEVRLLRFKDVSARLSGVILVKDGFASVTIPVEITLNPTTGKPEVSVDNVKVNRPKDERVEWTCKDGKFSVTFDKPEGCPFEESIYSAEKGTPKMSGAWKTGTLRSQYPYTVRVWPDGGGAPVELDPGVIVDDNGGDDGL